MNTPPIFLGSILLEPNRWKPGRPPSLRISEWSARAAAAGFDGWELWENHYLLAEVQEQSALRERVCPIRVLNSYADFGVIDQRSAVEAFAALRELPSVTAVKFNVGNDVRHIYRYRAAIDAVCAILPAGVRLWCECHPGTVLEDPLRLHDFIASDGTWPFDVIVHPFLLTPEKIIRWGEVIGERIKHAHLQMRDIKDPRRFVALADDPGRVSECIAALDQIHFSGSYTLEFGQHVRSAADKPSVLFEDSVRDLSFFRSKLRSVI